MSEIPLDSSGRIDTDVNCVGCEYNLRGLDGEAVCPECGMAVERSLRGDRLRFADPQWVGQLSRGMTLAWVSLVVAFFSAVILGSSFDLGSDRELLAVVVAGLLVMGPVGVAFAACWCFSMPEPGATKVAFSHNWRGIARASAILFVCVIFVLGIGASGIASYSSSAEVLFFGTVYVGVMVSIVGFHAAGRYAAGLAQRIPDKHLASHTMFVTMGGTLVGLSILFGMSVLIFVPQVSNSFSFFPAGPSLPQVFETILIFGALGTLVGGAVVGLGVLILMARYSYVLQNVAKLAKGESVDERANVQP